MTTEKKVDKSIWDNLPWGQRVKLVKEEDAGSGALCPTKEVPDSLLAGSDVLTQQLWTLPGQDKTPNPIAFFYWDE